MTARRSTDLRQRAGRQRSRQRSRRAPLAVAALLALLVLCGLFAAAAPAPAEAQVFTPFFVTSPAPVTITAFSFQGLSPAVVGSIDEGVHTIAVTVPLGTDVTALVATFTTTGAAVVVGTTVQVSGTTPNSFTSPVTYTVIAADGSTQAWVATVTPAVSVGDAYGGGIVAYILQPGDPGYVAGEPYGLIAAVAVQSATPPWALPAYASTAVPGGTGTALGTGAANTDKIIAQNGAGTGYAAGLARAYRGGGYADWYLPSTDELNKLWANRNAIGGFEWDKLYWASSEFDASYGGMLADGGTGGLIKSSTRGVVRAVRSCALTAGGITAFSFQGLSPAVIGRIDLRAHTIAATVPFGTDVTALVATFTTTGTAVRVRGTVQVSGSTPNDFTSPVPYTVVAADGSTQAWVATVTIAAPVIGQALGGGVIAYILQPGDPGYVAGDTRGLIAATADQSTGITWALPAYQLQSVPGGTGTALGTGAANTDKIIAQNGAGTGYAAGLARAYRGGGYADWYLPSTDELNKLWANRDAIGGFDSWNNRWTSSEAGGAYAFVLRSGTLDAYLKSHHSAFVRPVRSFALTAGGITAFSFQGLSPAVVGTIDDGARTIAVTVPFGTDLTALVATFTTTGTTVRVRGTAQVSGATPNDFTSPVTYTVVAVGSSTRAYVVTVTVARNPAVRITAFSFQGLSPAVVGTIDDGARTIAVTVPFGTSVTALVATFATTGTSVMVGTTVQVSGTTPNDFVRLVTYDVHAADGSTQHYVVTVRIAAPFIGQRYGGGVVAYILQPGDPGYSADEVHGLIAAVADQGNAFISWALRDYLATSVPGGTGTALGTGAANTDRIVAQNAAGTDYAAGLARAYRGGGYADWYLPSLDELNKLWVSRDAIGGFYTTGYGASFYWSSSEHGDTKAESKAFHSSGAQSDTRKSHGLRVRAVRSFGSAYVATRYVVTASAYGPAAGSTVTIRAQLADASGNPVATGGRVVTWSKSDASGSFTNATSMTDASGLATVGFITATVPGATTTITATDAGGLRGTSPAITTVVGPAVRIAVNAGDKQSATVGTAVEVPPSVIVTDDRGNPVAGAAVTFAVASGGGSATGTTTTTGANGVAAVGSWTLGPTAGANTLTATCGALAASTVTFTATGTTAKATRYVVTASSYDPVAGSTVTIRAQLADASGNPVATGGRVVTWTKSDAHGSLARATSTTDASGLATVGFVTHRVAGTRTTITATDAELLTGTSPAITTVSGGRSATSSLRTPPAWVPAGPR